MGAFRGPPWRRARVGAAARELRDESGPGRDEQCGGRTVHARHQPVQRDVVPRVGFLSVLHTPDGGAADSTAALGRVFYAPSDMATLPDSVDWASAGATTPVLEGRLRVVLDLRRDRSPRGRDVHQVRRTPPLAPSTLKVTLSHVTPSLLPRPDLAISPISARRRSSPCDDSPEDHGLRDRLRHGLGVRTRAINTWRTPGSAPRCRSAYTSADDTAPTCDASCDRWRRRRQTRSRTSTRTRTHLQAAVAQQPVAVVIDAVAAPAGCSTPAASGPRTAARNSTTPCSWSATAPTKRRAQNVSASVL